MKWVKTLNFESFELEKRVTKVLDYIHQFDSDARCYLLDLDATGKVGNTLSGKVNRGEPTDVSLSEILSIFEEDGQVIEMNLVISSKLGEFKIFVRRGSFVDILGEKETLPDSVLGDYEELDIGDFCSPKN